jgi:UDP-glucose 4-epimerase
LRIVDAFWASMKPEISSRKITVLGGLGFLGSHLCRALLAHGDSVRVFSKLYASRNLVTDIENDLTILEADIMQPREVLDVIGDSEIVIDLVHTTRPGSSMRDPAYDVASNVVSHVQWLEHLADTSVRRVIFVSSGGTVYGNPRSTPITEDHPTDPICSYGITKLAIEKYVAMYCGISGIGHTILRPANVYGPGNRLNVGQGVIGVLAHRALRGETLEVWGTGHSRRDYLYIDDFISAMMSLLDYQGSKTVFNVSSGKAHSVLDVVDTLSRTLGELPRAEHIPSREFDVPLNVLSYDRLARATGWEPLINLDDGIQRLVDWLRENSR